MNKTSWLLLVFEDVDVGVYCACLDSTKTCVGFCELHFLLSFFWSVTTGDSGYCLMNSSRTFFTFSSLYHISGSVYCSWNPQISHFSNFFIKNGSYDTIHTFKNYFATMFSVLIFNFNNNKFNPNKPIVSTQENCNESFSFKIWNQY